MSLREINIELKTPILVHNKTKGDEEEMSFLTITEPTGKQAHLIAIIEGEIAGATRKALEGIDLSDIEESKEEISEKEMAEASYVMLVSGGGDMEKITITFHQILKISGLMGGEKPITQPMIDRMTYSDYKTCLKEYIGNFIQS